MPGFLFYLSASGAFYPGFSHIYLLLWAIGMECRNRSDLRMLKGTTSYETTAFTRNRCDLVHFGIRISLDLYRLMWLRHRFFSHVDSAYEAFCSAFCSIGYFERTKYTRYFMLLRIVSTL